MQFQLGAQAQNWSLQPDPGQPLHVTLINQTGVSGPAELLRIVVSGAGGYGSVFAIRPARVHLANDRGIDRDVTSQTGGAEVAVVHTPIVHGDLNQDGQMDASEG